MRMTKVSIEVILSRDQINEHLDALRIAKSEGEEHESTNSTIKVLEDARNSNVWDES